MTQAILVKYHGPTNTKGARISATCAAGRLTVALNHGVDANENCALAAEALVHKLGWTADQGKGFEGVWVGGTLPNGDVVFVFRGDLCYADGHFVVN